MASKVQNRTEPLVHVLFLFNIWLWNPTIIYLKNIKEQWQANPDILIFHQTAPTHCLPLHFGELEFLVKQPCNSRILTHLGQKSMAKGGFLHCKEHTKKSKQRNCAATVPISTFMCLWAIYIFPQSICQFCCRKYVDRSGEFINRSQTHDCGNWDWGRIIPTKEIHKWDFRCGVVLLIGLNENAFFRLSRNLVYVGEISFSRKFSFSRSFLQICEKQIFVSTQHLYIKEGACSACVC